MVLGYSGLLLGSDLLFMERLWGPLQTCHPQGQGWGHKETPLAHGLCVSHVQAAASLNIHNSLVRYVVKSHFVVEDPELRDVK